MNRADFLIARARSTAEESRSSGELAVLHARIGALEAELQDALDPCDWTPVYELDDEGDPRTVGAMGYVPNDMLTYRAQQEVRWSAENEVRDGRDVAETEASLMPGRV